MDDRNPATNCSFDDPLPLPLLLLLLLLGAAGGAGAGAGAEDGSDTRGSS
jgi:hypothetical protein